MQVLHSPVRRVCDIFGYTKESHRAWYLKSRNQLTSFSTAKDRAAFLYFILEQW